MQPDTPGRPPEAVLIQRARKAAGLTAETAAAELRESGGRISTTYWRDVERGYGGRRGQRVPVRASDRVLAQMARVLRLSPHRLATEGQRADAAEILAEMERPAEPRPLRSLPAEDAPVPPDPARLEAALERVSAPIPQEYWDSTDSDYAWLAPPERIERAKEIGRVYEIRIWSNPEPKFTASQRRYAIALFRWQEAVAQGNHQQREADGLSRTPRPARIAIRSRLRLARAESAGIQYKKGS